jgi:hypothetical protein
MKTKTLLSSLVALGLVMSMVVLSSGCGESAEKGGPAPATGAANPGSVGVPNARPGVAGSGGPPAAATTQ